MERWKTHHPFFTNDQSSQRSIHQFSPSHVTSKTSRVISHVNVPRELNSSFQCPNSCIPSRKSGVIPRTRLDLESGKPRANQRIYAYFQGSSLSCEFVSSAEGVFSLVRPYVQIAGMGSAQWLRAKITPRLLENHLYALLKGRVSDVCLVGS